MRIIRRRFIAWSALLLAAFSLLACQPGNRAPDRALVVSKVRSAAKLATVEYVVTKVISAEKSHWLARDSYFFAETEARIKAGIDLSKLRADDIIMAGTRIELTLPAVEIVNFSYPAEGFQIIEQYTTPGNKRLWNSFSPKDKDKLYREAESAIWKEMHQLGIYQTAQDNTRRFLRQILASLGFNEIYIHFRQPKQSLKQIELQLNELTKQMSN